MRLMLASGNPHKLREFREILAPHDVLAMPGGIELPPEGSVSFEENARGKAAALAHRLALWSGSGRSADRKADATATVGELPDLVFGDDSGLEVEALGWRPGVCSSRFAGPDATDADNNRLLLAELAGESAVGGSERRRARFVCVLVAIDPRQVTLGDGAVGGGRPAIGPERAGADASEIAPTGAVLVVRGEWWGSIAPAPRGNRGFGYDPLFVPHGDDRTVAELPAAEKAAQSHRALAGRALLRELRARGSEEKGT